MNKWIDIDDAMKPKIGEKVLIKIPVCDIFNIESAKYKGNNQFVGCWCSTRGDGCAYKVLAWAYSSLLGE